MKNLLLIAYTRKNLGDDLMINKFINEYSDYENIYLSCSISKHKNYKNTKRASVWWGFYIWKILFKNTDVVVLGGSMWTNSQSFFKWKIITKFMRKNRLFLIGNSIDENYFKNKKRFHKLVELLIDNAEWISVRDLKSQKIFKSSSYFPDIVFDTKINTKNIETKSKLVCINYMSDIRKFKKYKNKYDEMIINYIEKNKEKEFIFVSFMKNDEIASKKFIKMNSINAKVFGYNDIDSSIKLLSECDELIATRNHAWILGLVLQKKIFCFAYDNKITNQAIQYNLKVFEPYDEGEIICERNDIDLDKIRKESKKHFTKFITKNN